MSALAPPSSGFRIALLALATAAFAPDTATIAVAGELPAIAARQRSEKKSFSDVILTVDNGDFTFLDCAYEELLQSLGPINDTTSVPWTMFNDNVSMGFFDVYDQYILNLLYDPRIKAGMTVLEVRSVLPDVIADVRAWVRKVNNLGE